MEKDRLTAFSDGVIAVIITIMVLDLKTPNETSLSALREALPTFVSYVLSFIYVAIYWNNHHHFFHKVKHVNGALLWANLHLLFWLSLIPFTTSWLGENHNASWPAALYGAVLLLNAVAWYILQCAIIRAQGPDSALRKALGSDIKGKISPMLYVIGIALAFTQAWLSEAVYVLVALMWVIPDRRMEARLGKAD